MAFEFISNHPFLVGVLMIGGFVLWKFIMQPIMNEGQPLDPNDEQVEGFKLDLGLPEEN